MSDSQNRVHLQSLTIAELMQEAHDMCNRAPNRFPTPDYAYIWLRFAIEPIFWDIRSEMFASGMHYVVYFGGEARVCVPHNGTPPAAFKRAEELIADWFNECYPKHLSASRWTVPHIALPAEVN